MMSQSIAFLYCFPLDVQFQVINVAEFEEHACSECI